MRIFIVGIILLAVSCKSLLNEVNVVTKPELQPLETYITPTFEEDFFREGHFGLYYLGDSIERQHQFTTETLILKDSTIFYLTNCKAQLTGQILKLEFSGHPFSDEWIGFNLIKQNNDFNIEYFDLALPLDSAAKTSLFTPISQNIILEKNLYQKGDILKGKLALVVYRCGRYASEQHCDTVKIYGLVKTFVE